MTKNEYLEVAARIGRRVASQALWEEDRCSWQVMVPDRTNAAERKSVPDAATPLLYQGTAGIAFFLGHLYAQTGEEEFKRVALGAMAHSFLNVDAIPENNFGFHSGRVGVAYAAALLADHLDREEFRPKAKQLLETMKGKEPFDQGIDVIGGAGGAIPALIEITRLLSDDLPAEIAINLGENLIRTAQREPKGWAWSTIGDSSVRWLNGLAHGASGLALALLELHHFTGQGRFRFAAEMGFLYERQSFSAEHSNWPDWRRMEIGDAFFYGRGEELRQQALAGAIPPFTPNYMSAWCHGAPGIGLARLRALELTGLERYREELDAALESTLGSLQSAREGFSLCHGIAGNCDLPLCASVQLKDAALYEQCQQSADTGWEQFEKAGRPWYCGTVGGAPDPSLMLGESGIGYFYLRMAEPESVPSVLLLRPQEVEAPRNDEDDSYSTQADAAIADYFGPSLQAAEAVLGRRPAIQLDGQRPMTASPVERASGALDELCAQTPGAEGEMLADVVARDQQRYRMTLEVTDFTEEYLRKLTRPPLQEADQPDTRYRIADHSHILTSRWDWDDWRRHRDQDNGSQPPRESLNFTLYFLRENRIMTRRVAAFSALVLQALEEPSTSAEVAAQLADSIDGAENLEPGVLEEKAREQLRQLYQAGFIDCQKA